MSNEIHQIIEYLYQKCGFDFSGYRPSMLERRITQRLPYTHCTTFAEYLEHIQQHAEELEKLISTLTIHVSRFFRNPLTFEYIARQIIPTIAHRKKMCGDTSLRVWSAGCSTGEEPFSMAMLFNEFSADEDLQLEPSIFATDIDSSTLKKAKTAIYPIESIEEVKYGILRKYFSAQGTSFQVIPEIRDKVSFSVYNILDKRSHAPAESIFGGFDIVLCRNVLIYFTPEHQNIIFEKLYRSLDQDGYLVLGESETPSDNYTRFFRRVNECCHIYQKV